MVVSLINGCAMSSAGAILKQSELETGIHWRQSPETVSPENNQQNCLVNFTNNGRRSHSPVQNMEENSCYDSENGADNSMSSPAQEASRSSGSEDNPSAHLFPISSSSSMMQQQCMEYSNSENESSQASPLSFNDEEGFRTTTKNGANGKMKVHKCRSCGFSTTNKHESWLHIAIHMKPEKILRCPDCPFVTEYKHHLDFHVWNHQGMKPYKCDKCPYVCVNKSMLKSHLKSHSNVYQYRCANCAYRTKYCHSLKIHLRKYRHEPGVVLDSEGNPNPNPVIDVYGNRRGPKQKPKKQDTSPVSGIQTIQSAVPQLSPFQNFPWMNNIFFTADSTKLRCPTIVPPMLGAGYLSEHRKIQELPLPVEQNGIQNSKNNLNLSNNNNNDNNQLNLQSCLTKDQTTLWSNENIYEKKSDSKEYDSRIMDNSCRPVTSPVYISPFDRLSQNTYETLHQNIHEISPYERLPQNMSIPNFENSPPNNTEGDNIECVPLNLSLSQSSNNEAATERKPTGQIVKNRRKGIACKLKRSYASAEEDEDSPKNIKVEIIDSAPPTETEQIYMHDDQRKSNEQEDSSGDDSSELISKMKSKKSSFYCGFCEITFFNQIMFTMHMGYHGYLDPFTCNRCGEKTEDNIAFYAHMISSAHM